MHSFQGRKLLNAWIVLLHIIITIFKAYIIKIDVKYIQPLNFSTCKRNENQIKTEDDQL